MIVYDLDYAWERASDEINMRFVWGVYLLLCNSWALSLVIRVVEVLFSNLCLEVIL
jgi:hypothetical protein